MEWICVVFVANVMSGILILATIRGMLCMVTKKVIVKD